MVGPCQCVDHVYRLQLTFFPQFILGYLGNPRRYHAYPDEFQVFHVMSTLGASILGVGYMHSVLLFAVVAEVWTQGERQPVASDWVGMADFLTTADA